MFNYYRMLPINSSKFKKDDLIKLIINKYLTLQGCGQGELK